MTNFLVQMDGVDGHEVVVESGYYKRDEGWVTFKTDDHKVVADFPESAIAYILRTDGQSKLVDSLGKGRTIENCAALVSN